MELIRVIEALRKLELIETKHLDSMYLDWNNCSFYFIFFKEENIKLKLKPKGDYKAGMDPID